MRLKFRIHVPGISERVITGSFEDAIEAFEEALWEAQLLPDEESLSATDHLGLAGGVYPEDILETQGFVTFAPDTYVEVIREEDTVTVTNPWTGAQVTTTPEELTQDKLSALAQLMDDQIREAIHSELAPCSNWRFWVAYVERVGPDEAGKLWFS